MKCERVYVVERKIVHLGQFARWEPAPITACGFKYLDAAKIRCRDLSGQFGGSFRVVAYERVDAKPLLIVKGGGNDA